MMSDKEVAASIAAAFTLVERTIRISVSPMASGSVSALRFGSMRIVDSKDLSLTSALSDSLSATSIFI